MNKINTGDVIKNYLHLTLIFLRIILSYIPKQNKRSNCCIAVCFVDV